MKYAHKAGQRRQKARWKKGSSPGFWNQRTADSAKAARRALVKSLGRRQALKAMKQARRQDKLAGATASMLGLA